MKHAYECIVTIPGVHCETQFYCTVGDDPRDCAELAVKQIPDTDLQIIAADLVRRLFALPVACDGPHREIVDGFRRVYVTVKRHTQH